MNEMCHVTFRTTTIHRTQMVGKRVLAFLTKVIDFADVDYTPLLLPLT